MNAKRYFILSGLIAACSLAQAGTYDPRDVGPNDLISGIYSVTVKQTGMTPVIHVKSDGKTYTEALPNQSVTWQASTRGVCRGAWRVYKYSWWINDNTKANPHGYYQHHEKLAEKIWINSKHSSGKFEAAGMLSTPVTATMANDAVKACNSRLQSELGKGKSIESVLSAEHTIYAADNDNPRMAGVVYLQCGGDQGLNTNLSHAWQNIQVNVKCDAHNFPKPKPAPVAKLATPFMLEAPKLNVTPTPYVGSCPVDLQAQGTLKANLGLQDVQYRWSHNGAMGPVATAKLNSSGWKTVNATFKDIGKQGGQGGGNGQQMQFQNQPPQQQGMQINANASNVHNGFVELKVLPVSDNNWNNAKTTKAPYSVTCKEPAKAKLVVAQPVAKSDLTYGSGLTIANATGVWGSTLQVDASAFNSIKRGDRCELRFAYDVLNKGQANAGSFSSRLFENAETLNQTQVNGLAAGGSHKVSGLLYLNDGMHMVGLSVDSNQQVVESNEANNVTRIMVQVRNCSGAVPARPGTPPRTVPGTPPQAVPGTPPRAVPGRPQ